jgi:hypothetical protein|tara:strand:+ start:105 stop:251 length:147 start_codon:yes stop_codon:yes gene_type:complete
VKLVETRVQEGLCGADAIDTAADENLSGYRDKPKPFLECFHRDRIRVS